MLYVERILNVPINSNCYIIYTDQNNACIIVDPGTEEPIELLRFLDSNDLYPEYIVLTHEHFDHIWGVNRLKEKYGIQLISNRNCSEQIIDKKKNLSLFYNQKGFVTYHSDIFIDEMPTLYWNDNEISFIQTPGHSLGSICFLVKDLLFTGNTVILNEKTVVKLPGANKADLLASISLLAKLKYCKIYSGHGESFFKEGFNIFNVL